jgi:hypothetical protein
MRFSCRSCDHPIESAPDSTLAVSTSAHVSGKLVHSWHHDGSFQETDLSSSRSGTADPERHSLDHPGKQAKSTRAEALPCLSPHPPRLTVWLCSALSHALDCWQSYFFAFLARPCHLPSELNVFYDGYNKRYKPCGCNSPVRGLWQQNRTYHLQHSSERRWHDNNHARLLSPTRDASKAICRAPCRPKSHRRTCSQMPRYRSRIAQTLLIGLRL